MSHTTKKIPKKKKEKVVFEYFHLSSSSSDTESSDVSLENVDEFINAQYSIEDLLKRKKARVQLPTPIPQSDELTIKVEAQSKVVKNVMDSVSAVPPSSALDPVRLSFPQVFRNYINNVDGGICSLILNEEEVDFIDFILVSDFSFAKETDLLIFLSGCSLSSVVTENPNYISIKRLIEKYLEQVNPQSFSQLFVQLFEQLDPHYVSAFLSFFPMNSFTTYLIVRSLFLIYFQIPDITYESIRSAFWKFQKEEDSFLQFTAGVALLEKLLVIGLKFFQISMTTFEDLSRALQIGMNSGEFVELGRIKTQVHLTRSHLGLYLKWYQNKTKITPTEHFFS